VARQCEMRYVFVRRIFRFESLELWARKMSGNFA